MLLCGTLQEEGGWRYQHPGDTCFREEAEIVMGETSSSVSIILALPCGEASTVQQSTPGQDFSFPWRTTV